MNLAEWALGGRAFGTVLVFLLMAGEIYTTFTFLGASGWAYGRGAPAFYIVCYGAVAYIMSYWLAPAVWRYARAHDLERERGNRSRKYSFNDSEDTGFASGDCSPIVLVAETDYLVPEVFHPVLLCAVALLALVMIVGRTVHVDGDVVAIVEEIRSGHGSFDEALGRRG